jgi:hypothetical protein
MIYSLIPLFFLGLRDIKYQKVKIWHVLIFVAFSILDLANISYNIAVILSGAFISYILVRFKIIQRVDGIILFIMALILGPWVFTAVFSIHICKSLIFKILNITESRASFLDSVFLGSVILCLS